MLAIRATLPHFSDSAAMKTANSWALSGIGTVPRSASRQRPRRRAAEQRDELATFHVEHLARALPPNDYEAREGRQDAL
jgi:hypothetical protein